MTAFSYKSMDDIVKNSWAEEHRNLFGELTERVIYNPTYTFPIPIDQEYPITFYDYSRSPLDLSEDMKTYIKSVTGGSKMEQFRMKDVKFYYDDLQLVTICILKTSLREVHGIARCHPKDVFDYYLGNKHAFADAIKKIPDINAREKMWEKFHTKYPIPKKERTKRKFGTEP